MLCSLSLSLSLSLSKSKGKRISLERGFSLVELSIVLVILGLLVGGILSGRSLIRAAELRSVTKEYHGFYTGVRAFRDKYFGLPGDITNATDFWGVDAAGCSSATAAIGPTCNGNGDGSFSSNAESVAAWEHLSNASLINGNFMGSADRPCTSPNRPYLITSCPPARIGEFWAVGNMGAGRGQGLAMGHNRMTPQEVWNIDTKIDDGKPSAGKVFAYSYSGAATICTDSLTEYDPLGSYLTTSDAKVCGIRFVNQF